MKLRRMNKLVAQMGKNVMTFPSLCQIPLTLTSYFKSCSRQRRDVYLESVRDFSEQIS